jgi:hypothetical protein
MKYTHVVISVSDRKDKKYKAFFTNNKKESKIVHFGASGYSDYTIHKDDERKKRYIERHKGNEKFNDPYSPGALSRWILWNMKSLRESIKDYKRRFGFK